MSMWHAGIVVSHLSSGYCQCRDFVYSPCPCGLLWCLKMVLLDVNVSAWYTTMDWHPIQFPPCAQWIGSGSTTTQTRRKCLLKLNE